MWRLALKSLVHDRARLAGSVLGMTIATVLAFSELGIFVGLQDSSSAIIGRTGGDVWVMKSGTAYFDAGKPMLDGIRPALAAHACVKRVRGVVTAFVTALTEKTSPVGAMLVGVETDQAAVVPWEIERGLPSDLKQWLNVSVDSLDQQRFGFAESALGESFKIQGLDVRVSVVTKGIKAFALSPYVFADIESARAIAGLSRGQSCYWIVDLADPRCSDDFLRWVPERLGAQGDVEAKLTSVFERQSQEFWMSGSGAGIVLKFAVFLSLAVAAAVVIQTLNASVRDHVKELAALLAFGVTRAQLIHFVLWQAAGLTLLGAIPGGFATLLVSRLAFDAGIRIALSPAVFLLGGAGLCGITALAAALACRSVLRIPVRLVFV